jgi:hypothetical protein
MVRPTHGHQGRYKWTCGNGNCKLPYELTSEQESLLNPWGAERYVTDGMKSEMDVELDAIHRKLDQAISAALFQGAMIGFVGFLLVQLIRSAISR